MERRKANKIYTAEIAIERSCGGTAGRGCCSQTFEGVVVVVGEFGGGTQSEYGRGRMAKRAEG